MDREEMRGAKRRELLARLNSYDSGTTEDDRREEKAREHGRDIGRQEALETGRRGLGSAGFPAFLRFFQVRMPAPWDRSAMAPREDPIFRPVSTGVRVSRKVA